MGSEFINRYADAGLLMLRIGIGAMYMFHGWPKITGGPQVWEGLGKAMGVFGITFAPAFWGFMAAFTEFVGGLCLMTGLLFGPFCALLTFEMLVASGMHITKGDGFVAASHAIEMCIIFFSLIFIGPGKFVLFSFL